MNILQSFIKSQGGTTIGGISFYYSEGQLRMRQANGPSKKQIKTSASCKPIRNNNAEFGFASQLSKSFRLRMGSVLKDFSDSQISGRLTGLFRNVIKKGIGVAGQREFNPYTYAALLRGFEFNCHRDFSTVWKPVIKCTRVVGSNAYLVQTTILPNEDIQAPAGATHVRFTLITLELSVIGFDAVRKKYASENAKSLNLSYKEKACTRFQMLPLDNKDAVAIEMRIFVLDEHVEKGSGVMLFLYGVSFFKGEVLMREGFVMKVGEVVCKL